MAKYIVEYSSNNSGGSWWLKDEDWKKLEASGWTVDWFKNQSNRIFKVDKDGRWLEAKASRASMEVVEASTAKAALFAAIKQWEDTLNNQSASDEGCNCCGAPHNFTAESVDPDNKECEYVSGDEVAELLTGFSGYSYREALEALKEKSKRCA